MELNQTNHHANSAQAADFFYAKAVLCIQSDESPQCLFKEVASELSDHTVWQSFYRCIDIRGRASGAAAGWQPVRQKWTDARGPVRTLLVLKQHSSTTKF